MEDSEDEAEQVASLDGKSNNETTMMEKFAPVLHQKRASNLSFLNSSPNTETPGAENV